jgi:hypothetical protein
MYKFKSNMSSLTLQSVPQLLSKTVLIHHIFGVTSWTQKLEHKWKQVHGEEGGDWYFIMQLSVSFYLRENICQC